MWNGITPEPGASNVDSDAVHTYVQVAIGSCLVVVAVEFTIRWFSQLNRSSSASLRLTHRWGVSGRGHRWSRQPHPFSLGDQGWWVNGCSGRWARGCRAQRAEPPSTYALSLVASRHTHIHTRTHREAHKRTRTHTHALTTSSARGRIMPAEHTHETKNALSRQALRKVSSRTTNTKTTNNNNNNHNDSNNNNHHHFHHHHPNHQ